MGFVPPKQPNRPDWMDDETWRRILLHEGDMLDRTSVHQAKMQEWLFVCIALANVIYLISLLLQGGKE